MAAVEVEPIVAEAKAVEPKAAAGWAVVEAAKGAAAAAAAAVDELEDTTGMAVITLWRWRPQKTQPVIARHRRAVCNCQAGEG